MPTPKVNPNMEYRRLGNTGMKVSIMSLGSWVTFDTQLDNTLATECIEAAGEAGCNFFDNAEAYAGGKSEEIMGKAFRDLGWERWSYVLTTKLYWGINGETPNMRNTLNRKYLMQGIDASLERLQHDFVDVLYCHRCDPETPLEEVVRAMSDIVSSGKATYWGTSEWTAEEIRGAIEIADKHHLHKPVTEQSQYNLLERRKYKDGIPEDSRGALAGYEWLQDRLSDGDALAQVEKLRPIADRLDCSMAQLALAWAAKHPMVSSVITGASKVSQVEQNFAAIDVIPLITDEVDEEMRAAVKR